MEMTLADVVQDIKARLLDAGQNRKSPMHTVTVGTADIDLRVMVLRAFYPDTYRLRLHTDVRSPKVKTITRDPRVSVLGYDPSAKVQIRMKGMAKIETIGAVADAAWAEATNFAKRCYLAQQAPSSPAGAPVSGLPDWVEGLNPTDDQILPARENFAVMLVDVQEFDWLYLANSGHRRAKVCLAGADQKPGLTWLVP